MNKENDKNESHKEDAFPTISLPDTSSVIGSEIGPFKLLSVLGEGGFGIVYLAEQKHPIKRQVALKIIKPGMDSKRIIARFEAERQALALLDHPNIAHIFEAGSTEAGHPYFVMEYIKGMPITDYCDHYQLKIEERLNLFIQVCEAVQHAHQKGIIHRDIKPSNIIVDIQDGKAHPKVIDFGVAKAIGMPLTEKTIFTQQGQLVGTPEYMSPEQADFKEKDIDIRTDIYSLGVVLYELLAGTLPFEPKSLREAGYAEIQRIIREQEPPRPSTKLSSLGEDATRVARNRHTEISTLVKSLHKELEWIPLKAIRKERDHRYKTASDLAEDIQNYLGGNSLAAGPESASYRFHKFVRRHQGLVAALSAIAALTIVSLIIITALYLQSEKSRNEIKKQSYCNSIALADVYKETDITYAGKLLEACPEDLRGWEWNWLYHNLDQSLLTISGHREWINSVCVSPDGKQIALAENDDGTIKIWVADSGNELRTLSSHQNEVRSVCFSPDGKRIASASEDNTIKIWDINTGNEIQTLSGNQIYIHSICFSQDGRRISSCSSYGPLEIWDVDSGHKVLTLGDHQEQGVMWSTATSVCFSPDGKRIASGDTVGTIKIWDADTGSVLQTIIAHKYPVWSLCFSPDGKRIASAPCSHDPEGSAEKAIKIWDAYSGSQLMSLSGYPYQGWIRSICFSPDGSWLAAGSYDSTIKIWDANSGTQLQTLSGHQDQVKYVCFSQDGKRIVSGSYDNTIKVWDVNSTRHVLSWRGYQDSTSIVCFSPDGKHIASAPISNDPEKSADTAIKIWDVDSSSPLMSLSSYPYQIWARSVCFSPDGKRITSASGDNDNTIKIWNTDNGTELRTLRNHKDRVTVVCFSPDGKKIASGSYDDTIKIWDADSGTELLTLTGQKNWIQSICFSPDGKKIVSSGLNDKTIKIWDADNGTELLTLSGHQGTVESVCYSPDGNRIASGSADNKIKIWDADSGTDLLTLSGHQDSVMSVCFSPDGKRIVSGSTDHTIKIWDADSGRELVTLRDHQNEVWSVCFSPDGKRIASGDYDGVIKIWNIASRDANK